jgi:hypothetical protein
VENLDKLVDEILNIKRMFTRYEGMLEIIHKAYYKMHPTDRRAIDRTRDDYPAFLLLGITENRRWE